MRLVIVLLVWLAVVLPARAQDRGETRPGFLGVEMRDLTRQEADAIGFEAPTGVWVVKPVPGGPAETAGVQAGDVILSVDGVEVQNAEKFRAAVGAKVRARKRGSASSARAGSRR